MSCRRYHRVSQLHLLRGAVDYIRVLRSMLDADDNIHYDYDNSSLSIGNESPAEGQGQGRVRNRCRRSRDRCHLCSVNKSLVTSGHRKRRRNARRTK